MIKGPLLTQVENSSSDPRCKTKWAQAQPLRCPQQSPIHPQPSRWPHSSSQGPPTSTGPKSTVQVLQTPPGPTLGSLNLPIPGPLGGPSNSPPPLLGVKLFPNCKEHSATPKQQRVRRGLHRQGLVPQGHLISLPYPCGGRTPLPTSWSEGLREGPGIQPVNGGLKLPCGGGKTPRVTAMCTHPEIPSLARCHPLMKGQHVGCLTSLLRPAWPHFTI